MIKARRAGADFTLRLKRRAEALAARRAQQMSREQRSADWRSAAALWPDFGTD
ncbi:MAG: hypothetical protein ACXIT4_03635 [Erythrobacter sp.]